MDDTTRSICVHPDEVLEGVSRRLMGIFEDGDSSNNGASNSSNNSTSNSSNNYTTSRSGNNNNNTKLIVHNDLTGTRTSKVDSSKTMALSDSPAVSKYNPTDPWNRKSGVATGKDLDPTYSAN
jgi:hypothetical protein